MDTPKRFKFGSNWYNAWQQVKIKANFGGKRGEIFFFVIELDIPTLLSRVCLEKLKAKIDFSERMLEIPHWKMKVPLELLYFFEDFSPSQYVFGNAPDFAADPNNDTSTMIKKKRKCGLTYVYSDVYFSCHGISFSPPTTSKLCKRQRFQMVLKK